MTISAKAQIDYWLESDTFPHASLWVALEPKHLITLQEACIARMSPSRSELSARAFTELRPGQTGAIKIDDVRQLINDLQLKTHEGHKRIAIIHQADRLNSQAANALLKVLEEPPPHSYIFLNSGSIQALPATLRSRCSLIYANIQKAPVQQLEDAGLYQALWCQLREMLSGPEGLCQVGQLLQYDTEVLLRHHMWIWAELMRYQAGGQSAVWLMTESVHYQAFTAQHSAYQIGQAWLACQKAYQSLRLNGSLNSQLLLEALHLDYHACLNPQG